MSDPFFASSKPRKRKRDGPDGNRSTPGGSSTRKPFTSGRGRGRGGSTRGGRGGPPDKRTGAGAGRGGPSKKPTRADEELSDQTDEDGGVDDMDLRGDDGLDADSGEEDDDETPAAKRLRLAKLYLESVKEGLADGEFDAAEIDKELISARLKQDVMEHSGKVHLFVADSFDFTQPPTTILRTRGHRFSITSAVASDSGKFLFTSGKEGSIIKWDLTTGKKLNTIYKVKPDLDTTKGKKGKGKAREEVKGHTDEVLSLALSSDGKYLASAGRDRRLTVWDVEKDAWIKGFSPGGMGHKDVISALAFRDGTHTLYTGSHDRTLKLYDLSPSVLGYVETLFGHQDHVLSLAALRGDTCVSVGGRDKTVRYWKIGDESQLVFRGGGRSKVREVLEGGLRDDDEEEEGEDALMEVDGAKKGKGKEKERIKKFVEGSLECVAMIDETTFVSGGDSGSISLWTTTKKKPIFTQPLAHGFHQTHSETEGLIETPRWITSIACLKYGDVIASGSYEGIIRLWKLDSKLKSITLVGTIPAPGVVNSLQFITPSKEFLDSATWATPPPPVPPATSDPLAPRAPPKLKTDPILLVVGLGQEHRLGRWLSMKGEKGAVNGTIVVAFSPKSMAVDDAASRTLTIA